MGWLSSPWKASEQGFVEVATVVSITSIKMLALAQDVSRALRVVCQLIRSLSILDLPSASR